MANHTQTCQGEDAIAVGMEGSVARFKVEHPNWWYNGEEKHDGSGFNDRLCCSDCGEQINCHGVI